MITIDFDFFSSPDMKSPAVCFVSKYCSDLVDAERDDGITYWITSN